MKLLSVCGSPRNGNTEWMLKHLHALADAIVFGTPVYFEMVSGLLKNFMDRTCPVWTKLEDKLFAGIAVAEEGIGTAIDNLKTYAAVCDMTWSGSVTALAKKPRDITKFEGIGEQLGQLYLAIKRDAA